VRECAESPRNQPLTQIAQNDPALAAKVKRDAAVAKLDATPGKSADVIKPKVVRTETIAPQSATAPARPVGNFEPKRVTPPVVPPTVSASAAPVSAVPAPAPSYQLASVPLPPARPDFAPTPKRETKSSRRSARLHERTAVRPTAEVRAEPKPKADSKPDPVGAVSSFVKKLLTPDKNARKPTVEAEADPPSHVQPPQ